MLATMSYTPTSSGPARRSSHESVLELLREETLGEYEILGELGRGGMATVYLAHDISLDRKVAIKVMAPSLMDEGLAERFRREARTAAALNHPHVIPIYAVRERAPLLFFVMKFIPGQSLDPILKTMGKMPIPMAQVILAQAAGALGYAHRRGVIHRDVKPANIMLDEEGWVVMTDFGIAKVSTATGLTMTGVTVGTPAYMSPEQCLGKEVTGASDQYSLGVVAYEMLTGTKPFQANTAMAMMYAHFNEEPKPILEIRPDVPPALAASVMRMLSKDPDKRLPKIDDVFGAPSLAHDDPTRQQLVSLALTSPNATIASRISTPTSPVPPARRSTTTRPPATTTPPTEPMTPATPAGGGSPPPVDPPPSGVDLAGEATRPLPREAAPAPARRTAAPPAAPRPTGKVVPSAKRRSWIPWAGAAAIGGLVLTLVLVRSTAKSPANQVEPIDSVTIPVGPSDNVRVPSGGTQPADTARPTLDTAGRQPEPPKPPEVIASVGRIQIQPARLALEAGQSASLALQLWAADGSPIREPRETRWTSSVPGVLAVGADGTVRGVRAGRATVTATVNGKKATATIEVRAPAPPPATAPAVAAVATVTVTPTAVTLTAGRTAQLQAVLRDARGNLLESRPISWTSSSSAVSVAPTGQVQGLAPGTAVVTATVDGRSASATITVPQLPVASVRLTAPSGPLKPGDSFQLSASAHDATGAALEGRTVAWSSGSPEVATVAAGRVVARAPGSAEITATVEGQKATVRVVVASPAPDPAVVARELDRQLDAFVDALNRRNMTLLRRAYPGLTSAEETRWKGMLEEKSLTRLEASRGGTQPPQIEEKAAEVRFTLRLRLQSAGAPVNEFTTNYRGLFEHDGGTWELRRLVQVP